MSKVRLELNSIEMLVERNRWSLYFIIYTSHPKDSLKSLVRILPKTGTIQLTKNSLNPYSFKPKGLGTNGLKVYQGVLNEDRSVDISMSIMQSRKRLRSTAEILGDIKDKLTVKGLNRILRLSRLEWLVVDASIDAVTNALRSLKDKELGFISMDEQFGDEFKSNPKQERWQEISSGKAKLNWIWEVKA